MTCRQTDYPTLAWDGGIERSLDASSSLATAPVEALAYQARLSPDSTRADNVLGKYCH